MVEFVYMAPKLMSSCQLFKWYKCIDLLTSPTSNRSYVASTSCFLNAVSAFCSRCRSISSNHHVP